jgi:hypothetical protein
MNLIKLLGVLFVGAQRLRARRVARWWIQELDSLGDDGDAADALWKSIELWLNAHPVNCQEFLKLFRASRDVQEASSAEPFIWPAAYLSDTLCADIAPASPKVPCSAPPPLE